MDHRRVAAVLVLSAVMAVLGHTHEEAVVNLGEHTALTGPVAGKVAQIGESNGEPQFQLSRQKTSSAIPSASPLKLPLHHVWRVCF